MTFVTEHGKRRSSAACLSSLEIMRAALDEPLADARRAHLEGCASCRDACAQARHEQQRFASETDLATLAARTQVAAAQRPSRSAPRIDAWRLGLSLVAMTASGLLFIVATQPSNDVRLKGGAPPTLRVLVDRNPVTTLRDGDVVSPGSRLRFVVDSASESRPLFVAVLGEDETGRVWRGFPQQGTTPGAVPRGPNQLLPGAVVLDDVGRSERIVFFACEDARLLADLEKAIKQPTTPIADCHMRALTLGKRGAR